MEITIERILPGGLGLAHAEGKTIMVPLAAPGDRLRVQIDRVKGSVSFARILEVLTPSSQRVEPPCPYFGRCGGCDFQQLNYEAQLAAKVEIIKDCLHRIGRLEDIPDFQISPAPTPWHYRSRAQWQYDSIQQHLGYFESGSRRVCDVSECAVLAPELQLTLDNLRQKMQEGTLPEDARDFRVVSGDDCVAVRPRVLGPTGTDVARTIQGDVFHLNTESFFQTNDDLLPELIDAALRVANGDSAIELYCGVGLFTLPLARQFKRVIGVEADRRAAEFAVRNLAGNGLVNAEIANRDVADWLEQTSMNKTDFLLLDPPRTGAESRVIAGILRLKPRHISYVSCDPATLARDLKKLMAGGYALDSVAAFDMFPQTHHVETVVHLMANG